MTSSPDVVSSHTFTSLPTIYIANGSPMHVSHLGNVSTPALSVSNVYQIPITTQGGSRYFVIFVDDFSIYTWIYLFKNHSELSQIYRDFTKMIETQFSKPIKVFRYDNA